MIEELAKYDTGWLQSDYAFIMLQDPEDELIEIYKRELIRRKAPIPINIRWNDRIYLHDNVVFELRK